MSNEALKLIEDCIDRLEASKRVLLNQSTQSFKDMPVNQVLMDNQPYTKQWKVERTAPTLKAVLFFKDRTPASRIEHQGEETVSGFLNHVAKVIEAEGDDGYQLLDLNVVTQRHSEMTTVDSETPNEESSGIADEIQQEFKEPKPNEDDSNN